MSWKPVGQNVIGSSHLVSGKPCEDAIHYAIIPLSNGESVLIAAVSDGAGSAKFAKEASTFTVDQMVNLLTEIIGRKQFLEEADIHEAAETICSSLEIQATSVKEEVNEFSCTLLGCVVFSAYAFFFQVGDGAIIRDDGAGYYVPVWWPQNGEYQNTTNFLIDGAKSNFQVMEISEPVNEVAILSDGLQLMALNFDNQNVHQPFFKTMFDPLRLADDKSRLAILNDKLKQYLSSPAINSRTDDDKTLFLATRLNP